MNRTYSLRQAFALSAEEVRNALPPGTSKIIGHAAHGPDVEHDEGTVLLVPQPSQDPADPLNWPFWRKIMLLIVVSMYGFAANFSSSVPAAALPDFLATFYTKTFPQITHIQAINVLPLGGASIILTPLANCFGRRPIMLIAMAILAFSSLGAAKCTTFEGLLIARFCQGFGGSAADTISPDMVGEVFFVHQGGRGVAVYTTLLALGSIVGGVSGGNIAAVYGWPGVFWVSFIMNGIIFLSGIFLMPETMFDRKSRLAVEANFHSEQADSSSNDKGEVKVVETTAGSGSAIAYPPFTFMQSLQMGTYRGNLLGLFIAPLKTLRFPGVLLMMSLYGVLVGAIVTVSTMGPQFMAMPPYLWGANAGLIGLGGIGGLCLGAIYTYGVADRVMMILAKRNVSGLAEPETRLPTMLPSIAIGVAGSLMFGFCAEHPAPGRWGGMAVGYGCISFALLQVPSIGFNYLIQSYNAVSGDCLLMVTVFRALITFTFTFEAAAWVEHSGAAEPFGIIAMLLGIAGLFVIPQWKYGKRTRLWTAKWLPEKVDH